MARLKQPGRISAPDPEFCRRLEFEAPGKVDMVVSTTVSEPPAAVENAPPGGAARDGATDAQKAPQRVQTAQRRAHAHPVTRPDMVTIRLLYRLPDNLVARAAAWAAKARCPVGTVLRRAMAELRPDLVAALETGIDYRDVPVDRAKASAHRFDSSITLSRAAHDRLCTELDPEGLAGLTPSLSRWVRAKAVVHLEDYLHRAGY